MSLDRIKVKDSLTKSVLAGSTYAAGQLLIFGDQNTVTIPMTNIQMPAIAAGFIAGMSSSLISDVAHDYLLPLIPKNEKYVNAESALVGAGVSGLASCLMLKAVADLPFENFPICIAYGGGSYVASDFLWHNVVSKKEGGFLL